MSIFSPKESFLSEEDVLRLQQYKRYKDIYDGAHTKVFNNLPVGESRTYIPVDVAKIISNTAADLLFGEPPRYIVGEPDTQEALDRIVKDNSFNALCQQSALINSIKGDALFKLRFGKRTKYAKTEEVIIEVIQPDIYFPEVNPDNVKDIISITLGWIREVDGRTYLRLEKHTPGLILNELWESDEDWTLKKKVNLRTLYPDIQEEQETGIDEFLIVHVPNFVSGDSHFGDSDYKGLEALFDEYNNRLSRIAEILDKHSNPKLIVPEGIIGHNGITYQRDLDMIEVGAGGTAPSYITWDAQLSAAYSELDRIMDNILLVAEISPSLLGKDNGGQAESGRALKYRLINTMRKINKKRVFYTEAIQQLLYVAQLLDNEYGGNIYPVLEVDIQWNDGLPNDTQETIDDMIKLYQAGVINKRAALKAIYPQLSEDAIDEMVAEDKKPDEV